MRTCEICKQKPATIGWRCAECSKSVRRANAKLYDRYRDPVLVKFYGSKEWTQTSLLLRRYNPQCQQIDLDTGEQCTHKSEVAHHLVDPKDDMTKRTDWSNLVAVCYHHHQGGQRGETQGYRYVATIEPGFLGQAEKVHHHDGSYPHWHRLFGETRPARTYGGNIVSDGKPIHGTTVCTVGASKLDEALNIDLDELLKGI